MDYKRLMGLVVVIINGSILVLVQERMRYRSQMSPLLPVVPKTSTKITPYYFHSGFILCSQLIPLLPRSSTPPP